jgi:multiple sugar transport system substrate-binding protein
MMDRNMRREARAMAEAYQAGRMSRRTFVTRLLGFGLSASVVAAMAREVRPAAADQLKGKVRFLVGPWSDGEVDHQKHIAQGFSALHPDVSFDFRLYQWDTASQEISTSVAEGGHDIYMTTESSYPDYEAGSGFADLTSRINDPSFAEEKAKFLYWERTQSYGPKLLGLPISWHVEDALFVNMDMVAAAGHDESFVNSWDSFLDCVTKMTKPGQTFGCGYFG